ncbi:hypothetical protein MUK42_06817 [Musa troglodytarum]|uniref:Uncharacterized protein n=1 Tax=Musa troglodytarum TaxID=320322 RepID=A0A9E7L7Q5_9LILI|nr:hypothetical protein MUK42_06817 [Musa troglodytarum]
MIPSRPCVATNSELGAGEEDEIARRSYARPTQLSRSSKAPTFTPQAIDPVVGSCPQALGHLLRHSCEARRDEARASRHHSHPHDPELALALLLPLPSMLSTVAFAADAFCRCLHRRRSGTSLPLSLMDGSVGLARAYSFLPSSRRVQFLPLSRERTAGSSTTDRRPLELPSLPLPLLSFAALP